MKFCSRKYNTIYVIKCNTDNKTQSSQMWPKPFTKSFTSSTGSNWIFNTGFLIYKEGPDVNNFTKALLRF